MRAPRQLPELSPINVPACFVRTSPKLTSQVSPRIVLVGDESSAPYERPPLSKAVLRGEADIDGAIDTIQQAFANDPYNNWVYPDRSKVHQFLTVHQVQH